jgi:hypothetical protein
VPAAMPRSLVLSKGGRVAVLALGGLASCTRVRAHYPAPNPCDGMGLSLATASPSTSASLPGVDGLPEPQDCALTIPVADRSDLAAYDTFVERQLDLPPHDGALFAARISPSFRPEQALSLHRTTSGAYVLRSVRLTEDVWAEMMDRMARSQPGGIVHMDEQRQARALAQLHPGRVVRERFVDGQTAQLMLTTWRSVLSRTPISAQSDIVRVVADGTQYRVWSDAGAFETSSPTGVLGVAVSSLERFACIVSNPTNRDCSQLAVARREMQEALQEAQDQRTCLSRRTAAPHP